MLTDKDSGKNLLESFILFKIFYILLFTNTEKYCIIYIEQICKNIKLGATL